jgi:hypothetical protein
MLSIVLRTTNSSTNYEQNCDGEYAIKIAVLFRFYWESAPIQAKSLLPVETGLPDNTGRSDLGCMGVLFRLHKHWYRNGPRRESYGWPFTMAFSRFAGAHWSASGEARGLGWGGSPKCHYYYRLFTAAVLISRIALDGGEANGIR